MTVTAADFQPFIDWYSSSGVIWKHKVIFDLQRVFPDGLPDDRVHYQGEFVCVPSQVIGTSDRKGLTFVPGNLHGIGKYFSPYILDSNPPTVFILISLKPITIGMFFVNGWAYELSDKLFESIALDKVTDWTNDFVVRFTLPTQPSEYRLALSTAQTTPLNMTSVSAVVPSLTK